MIDRLIISLCLVLSFFGEGLGQSGPGNIRSGLEMALDSLDAGRYKSAKELLLSAKEEYGRSSQVDPRLEIELSLALGEVFIELRNYEDALVNYQTALSNAKVMVPLDSQLLRDAYDGRSWVYSKMYRPIQSVKDLERVFALDTAMHGLQSKDAANTLMNMGLDYYKAGYFLDAEQVMLQALEIFKVVAEENSVDFNRIYNNLGIVYKKMGDYERALNYAEKALEIKLKNYDPEHPSVAKYYMNIGTVLSEMDRSQEAIPYMEKNISILKKSFPEENLNITGAKGELANVLADARQYEASIRLHQQVLLTEKSLVEETHPYHIAGYFNLAQIYLENSQPRLALDIVQKVEQLEAEASYFPLHKRLKTQLLKVSILDSLDLESEAKSLIKDQLSLIGGAQALFSDAAIQQYKKFQERELLVQLLESFADHYEDEDPLRYWQSLSLAVNLVEEIRRGYHGQISTRFLNESSSKLFAKAVGAAYTLAQKTKEEKYFHSVLQMADKARGNRLKMAIRQQHAIKIAGVPAYLQDSIAQVKLWIAEAIERIEESKEDSETEQQLEVKENELQDLQEMYWSLLDGIESNYPSYYRLVFGAENLEMPKLQKLLAEGNAFMLSYFLDEEHLYRFEIDGDNFKVIRFEKPTNFSGVLADFLKENNPEAAWKGSSSIDNFFKNGKKLSAWLLPKKLPNKERIIVVPFGELNFLPFELLLLDEEDEMSNDFQKANFLLKRYAVSYAPSVSSWINRLQEKGNKELQFSGFAPDYPSETDGQERSHFSRLYWNKEEVESISSEFSGSIFIGSEASKSNFKKMAPGSSILHLAMHARASENPGNSGLIFYNVNKQKEEVLNTYEIYNLTIPAKLLYLNACNTGAGRLEAGEGLVSLAHAFKYAGCKSICLNKWLVDDQAAASIAKAFYDNLKKGDKKDVALQKAKLSYLEKADPLTSHPYYWAGTILYGDIHPLESHDSVWWIFLLVGISLVGIAVMWFVKFR